MKKKVMIVDDAPLMRLVIKNLLEADATFEVVGVASNGQEAIERMEQLAPDLVFLDIEMPVMDGLEFLRRTRGRRSAKVVVLSSIAQAGAPAAAEARMLGAAAVVSKPSGAVSFDLEEKRGSALLTTAKKLLGLPA